jgi:hypothetical protein
MNLQDLSYEDDTMKSKNILKDDRGVSETVGFIIIFGIVITGIGLVTLYGYPVLLSQQAEANLRNMQKNMIILQSDMNSLAYKNVPYQETMLQVSGGTLLTKPSSIQSFSIHNSTDQVIPDFSPGELVFQSENGDAVISLENGAVHIRYWSDLVGSSMISNPRWFFDEDTKTLIITFMQIFSDANLGNSGISTVQMKVSELPSFSVSQEYVSPGDTIEIQYNPDPQNNYKVAWKNYFNSIEANEYSGDDAILRISGVENLVVKGYKITIISL